MIVKMKALIGFGQMKEDELLVAARTIINAMRDNSNFPNPTPTLDEVETLLEDFSDKLAIARRRGSPEETAIKDDSIPPLVAALQKLGYYVNLVADGHPAALLSSGFRTNGPAIASVVPPQVENVRLSDGRQSGQIRLDFNKQVGIRIYEYCYRIAGSLGAAWSDRSSTTSSRGNIIALLEPGQRYEVRVRAVNTKGAGDWSQGVSLIAR